MKGIKSKVITDEETVRMHTNFVSNPNFYVAFESQDSGTYEIDREKGTVTIHTNAIKGYAYVTCHIPSEYAVKGTYGISIKSPNEVTPLLLTDTWSAMAETLKSWYDGKCATSIVKISQEHQAYGIRVNLSSNTDYELSDFRIWQIDDATTSTGGGNS